MRDCANVEMRDRLPDLLHERLAVALRLEVQRHVDGCEACAAELVILRTVVAATRAPTVDVARIVSVLPPYRVAPRWRRMAVSPRLRVAAALMILAGGTAVVATTMRDGREETLFAGRGVGSIADSAPNVGQTVAVRTVASGATELAVGEPLHDLSDTELRALLDDLGTFDGMTSSETEVVPPSLERGGVAP
jgi:hypothetical protein